MADMTDESQPAEYIDSKPNTFETVSIFESIETSESLDWDDELEVEVPALGLGGSATAHGTRNAERASKTGAAAGAALLAVLLGLAYSLHRRWRPRTLLSRA